MGTKKKRKEKKRKTLRRAKKEKKKEEYKVSSVYEVKENKVERKRTPCPKCGEGYFLAKHKDRYHCGHCNYTRWKK